MIYDLNWRSFERERGAMLIIMPGVRSDPGPSSGDCYDFWTMKIKALS